MGRRTKSNVVFLDTHIIVWIYSGQSKLISPKAERAIVEAQDIFISPIVELELEYLYEIGRINEKSEKIIYSLHNSMNLQTSNSSFIKISRKALEYFWTRDVFDRLIVANTEVDGGILISKDRKILRNYPNTIW